MKTNTLKSIILSIAILLNVSSFAQKIPAFFKVGVQSGSITEVTNKVETALKAENFKIIGSYNPGGDSNLGVIVYTHSNLAATVLKVKDRGAMAAALKIGLKKSGNNVVISMQNPTFLFNGYLGKNADTHSAKLKEVKNLAVKAMKTLGSDFTPFGGKVEKKDLQKYQYMWGMPYFTDPVELAEFESFEKGVATIEKNLLAHVGNTSLVYKLKYSSAKVAVYGIALKDKTTGEANFLPIIGTDNVAAMPYEIILQGNKATMLHGRFRLAFGWPELAMSTFSKIMSTPGDIETTMKLLVK